MMLDEIKNDQPNPNTDYSSSVFFCFSIDNTIYNKEFFKINTTFLKDLNFEAYRIQNFTVVRVFPGGFFGAITKLIRTNYIFTINYIDNNGKIIYNSRNKYICEKEKIKYEYDPGRNASISSNLFKIPTCLEQYNSFLKITKESESLFSNTKNYLIEYLDMELYLYLLETKIDKTQILLDILNNFPSLNVKYEKDKPLQNIKFESLSKYENYNKLIIIYSIIQDSIQLLNELNDNDFNIIFRYNENQKDYPIFIKKNVFNFLLEKIKNLEMIKKICQNCESIPLLFDYLIDILNNNSNNFQKIKELTINNLPNIDYKNDNLIE